MVLSQFSSHDDKKHLGDFFKVPKDVYPVGRLDYDSEGLLILTNDTALNSRLLHPKHEHEREYWVQVEGDISFEKLHQLSIGVSISIDGKTHMTKPAIAKSITENLIVAERNPPIRFRNNIPTSWISLTLKEGKNRQVRRMTAKVGHPTLRLIRERIGNVLLGEMQPGEMIEVSREDLFKKLFT